MAQSILNLAKFFVRMLLYVVLWFIDFPCSLLGHKRERVLGGILVKHERIGEFVTGGERCSRCGSTWMGFGEDAKQL